MHIGGSEHSNALLRFDVHQRAKLDVRAGDEEMKLQLRAKLDAHVHAAHGELDRGSAAHAVVKLAESIKLRLHGASEGSESVASAFGELAAAFTDALTELASAFESPEGSSPEALVAGLRDAFTALVNGIRELYESPAETPATPAPVEPPPEATDAEPLSAESPDGVEVPAESGASTSDDDARRAPALEDWRSLRHDLIEQFTAALRGLLRELSGHDHGHRHGHHRGEATGDDGDDTARPERFRELRARFDLRQRLELRIVDTSA